ncbi:MAG: hypothetical protein NC517_01435 [Firmicutes bacterium]|nr:hypothetical protein [Bacillota bacterium]
MFSDTFAALRRIGRKLVLPTETIKELVIRSIPELSGDIVDLGAGTLYWSKWLVSQYGFCCFAVDSYYKTGQTSECRNIVLYNDYGLCIEDNPKPAMLWMCDVMHHLDASMCKKVLESTEHTEYKYIVIKDIDCRKKVGNIMNKLHDFLINHEVVHNVDPQQIEILLERNGYDIRHYDIPKLWYPHFLIIAMRNQ